MMPEPVRCCIVCGNQIIRRAGERRNKFACRQTCSFGCKCKLITIRNMERKLAPAAVRVRQCSMCGNDFRVKSSDQQCCSSACGHEMSRRKNAERGYVMFNDEVKLPDPVAVANMLPHDAFCDDARAEESDRHGRVSGALNVHVPTASSAEWAV